MSLSALPDDLPDATMYWLRGFLAGQVPRLDEEQPDDLDLWKQRVDEFLTTGDWPQLNRPMVVGSRSFMLALGDRVTVTVSEGDLLVGDEGEVVGVSEDRTAVGIWVDRLHLVHAVAVDHVRK